MSPSTLRRIKKRKQEFLEKKKKESSDQDTSTTTDLEASSQVEKVVKCDLSEKVFKSESGLKIHIGKSHKGTDPPPTENLIDTSSLKGSLLKESKRDDEQLSCGEEDEKNNEFRMDCEICGWLSHARTIHVNVHKLREHGISLR